MKTLFLNAHLISPDLDLAQASVLVENGVVAELLLPGEELPADFICPLCKHGAADFERVQ